jgi:sterol 14-demethylase
MISEYTDPTSNEPLHQRLSAIPLSVWEGSMPIFDAVLRETVRFTAVGPLMRRNLEENFSIGGKIVRKGSYLVYSLLDGHFDPDVYEDPEKFDPDRYGAGREEDKKKPLAYLGWGHGAQLKLYLGQIAVPQHFVC